MKQLQGKDWDGPAKCHDLIHAEQLSIISDTTLLKNDAVIEQRELPAETAGTLDFCVRCCEDTHCILILSDWTCKEACVHVYK